VKPNEVKSRHSLSKYIERLESELPKQMRESRAEPQDCVRAIRSALLDKSYSSKVSALNSSDLRFIGEAIAAGTCYE
jgi:hypothetical protein